MKIGFYYHIPVCITEKGLATAGALGCFLDALAVEVSELVLFLHEAEEGDPGMDYELEARNVTLVSLGRKPHAVSRTFFGSRLVMPVCVEVSCCDLLLIRAPTHLFGAWARLCNKEGVVLVPLLVGDFTSGSANVDFSFLKKQLLKWLNFFVDRQERRLLSGKQVLVNSAALAEKYRPIAEVVYQVRTTTLSKDSFFEREDTCVDDEINILYTGRFDWQKGLQELVDAFVALVLKAGFDAKLHFAGWQDSGGESIEDKIIQQAQGYGISNRLIFHGYKKVGPELDSLYRMADIYVCPSYAEGFPRALWEAMANSCPVIATNVGGIPQCLENGKHALLIEPKDTGAIFNGVSRLIDNSVLRRRLISQGLILSRTNTLDVQTKKLCSILREICESKNTRSA